MAGELTTSLSVAFKKGTTDEKHEVKDRRSDVTGTEFTKERQVIGTSAEPLDLGDVPAGYTVLVENPSDSVNFVSLRVGAAGVNFAKLAPGRATYLPTSPDANGASAIHAIADTAPVTVKFLAVAP